MVQGYGSYKLIGSNPSMLPDGAGDIKYEQDYIRDKAWLWDRIGALMMDVFAMSSAAGILIRGGVVTDDGSHTKVNISAGVGYAPYTINLGTSNAVPPATAAEDLSPVRVSWGNLSSQGNINSSGTWYVKMAYAETDWLSRLRRFTGTSWFFGKQPSFTLTIDQSAPTAYQILLATIVSTGSAFTSITPASANAGTQEYDLVIDSNAKLDLLCQAVNGQYKRVLVKSGTWTASALSPTAGVLINLDSTGTTYVFAERGSSINYSSSYAGNIYGLYHASIATDMSLELFQGVNISITSTDAVHECYAFYKCTNLIGCTGNGSGAGGGFGIHTCNNLVQCTGTGVGITAAYGYGIYNCNRLDECTGNGIGAGTGSAVAFSTCTSLNICTGIASGTTSGYKWGFGDCTNLTNCTGSVTGGTTTGAGFNNCANLTNCTGSGTGTTTGTGFANCANLTNCTGSGTGTSSGTGTGFSICTSLTNCTGTGTGAGGGGYGLSYCIGAALCAGKGLDSGAGVGYGFIACHKMQQNKPNGASKTATYNTSYADSGTTNACADTAAGGYNS